jgi:hypothetical protein
MSFVKINFRAQVFAMLWKTRILGPMLCVDIMFKYISTCKIARGSDGAQLEVCTIIHS